MSRSAWASCACLAVALAAAGAPSGARADTKLAVAKVANDFALMMVDYGKSLGAFQKNGLDVEVTQITQAKMIQAVVAGSIDMALGSGAVLAFRPKGAPLTGRRRFVRSAVDPGSHRSARRLDHRARSVARPPCRRHQPGLADRLGGLADCAPRGLGAVGHHARFSRRHDGARCRAQSEQCRRRRHRHRNRARTRAARPGQDPGELRRPDHEIFRIRSSMRPAT